MKRHKMATKSQKTATERQRDTILCFIFEPYSGRWGSNLSYFQQLHNVNFKKHTHVMWCMCPDHTFNTCSRLSLTRKRYVEFLLLLGYFLKYYIAMVSHVDGYQWDSCHNLPSALLSLVHISTKGFSGELVPPHDMKRVSHSGVISYLK